MPLNKTSETISCTALMQGDQETMQKLSDFLIYSNIESKCTYDKDTDSWVVYINDNQLEEATKLSVAFSRSEDKQEEDSDTNSESSEAKIQTAYVKKEDKYKDLQSSAYSFIFVGVVGTTLLSLQLFGVFKFNLNGKYFVYLVMEVLFIIFIIIGILTYRRSRIVSDEAKLENEFTNQVNEWISNNITADSITIDASEGDSDEIIYFKRCEYVKNLIVEHFGELDDGYLDKLVDDFYTSLFDNSSH